MNAQYVSLSSLVVHFTHTGDDTNMRQYLVIIYLVINTRLHHIGYGLKTGKKKIIVLNCSFLKKLAMLYDH